MEECWKIKLGDKQDNIKKGYCTVNEKTTDPKCHNWC